MVDLLRIQRRPSLVAMSEEKVAMVEGLKRDTALEKELWCNYHPAREDD